MSENENEKKVGFCSVCDFTQSYAPGNMTLMADRPDIDWASKPDVYSGDTWYCGGCGSSTDIEIVESTHEGY